MKYSLMCVKAHLSTVRLGKKNQKGQPVPKILPSQSSSDLGQVLLLVAGCADKTPLCQLP